ncbi:MAG: hypothetical protein ACJAZ2_002025 [Glaciecola sp.]
MEILTTIVGFILLGGLVVSPFLILHRLNKRNVKYKFIVYVVLEIITTVAIIFTFAWWVDAANQILLSHYGYDFDAVSETDRLVHVTVENMERVKSLRVSMMGIGWPLKAYMTCIQYYPYFSAYLLLVYVVSKIRKGKNKKNRSALK